MPASARQLRELRETLDARFPNATPVPRITTDGVATGVAALDAVLPNGGFPKGRLSVWAPLGGATAMLRSAVTATARTGERVVWVDGGGTVPGTWWRSGPVLLKPVDRVRALRATEQVLRSGGFALVVLTGVEPAGTDSVRLSRAAHEGGTALVACMTNAAMAALRIVSRIEPGAYRWTRDPHGDPASVMGAMVTVRVTALGWNRRVRIEVPVLEYELPSALPPMLPDRRGVSATLRLAGLSR
jgi:hypothetical protein